MSEFARLKDKLSGLDRPYTVALTSGKGGVGTSSLSLLLAAGLASQDVRILLIDADFGLGNQHLFVGLSPVFSAEDVLDGACTIEEARVELSPNLCLIPARSGLIDTKLIPCIEMRQLVKTLTWIRSNFDLVIIDGGAGMSDRIATIAELTDAVMVVTTPDIASIADSYAVAKYLLQGKSTAQLGFVVNRATSDDEGKRTAKNLMQMIAQFLDYESNLSAYVLESDDFGVGRKFHGGLDPKSWNNSLGSGIRAISEAISRSMPDDPSYWSGEHWTPTHAISKLNNQMINDDKIKRDSGIQGGYVHAMPELESSSSRKDSL